MVIPETARTWIKYLSNDGSSNNPSPDVAGGNFIQVFGTQVRETMEKDIRFIPLSKGYGNHFEGFETLAMDFLKVNFGIEISGRVYSGKDGLHSLPSSMRNADDDGTVSGENVSFSSFDSFVFLGATGIKHDSESVVRTDTDPDTDLTRGTDYEMDYDRGRIKLLNTSDTATGGDYEISYTFEGSAYNIASTVRRMAQLGGAALIETDRTDYTAGSGESARNYTVQLKTVEIRRRPETPDMVELTLNTRVAQDRD